MSYPHRRFVVRPMVRDLFMVVDTMPRTLIDRDGLPYTCRSYCMAAGLYRAEAEAHANELEANPPEPIEAP